ncbi:hypothetical protein [Rhizosaccharibacter radicis]|uniref:Copper chaperone PCu(A)C n=1 Tax=Rhizosaccharibacter radicis TaxID=2782605 RepID=A0ABT1VVU2_9PROT|nr:hypothetical protein [Acetobacteraceae bacterium KSS12]
MSLPERRRTRAGLMSAMLAGMLAGTGLLAAPMAARALSQVAGPVQVGPSAATGDENRHSARMSTLITNFGGLPDRLINLSCPNADSVTLLNGSLHDRTMSPTLDQQAAARQEEAANPDHTRQNGLDIPAALRGRPATPVTAQIALAGARVPVTDGALVPCSLFFAHAGQRVVVFEMGTSADQTLEP